MGSYFLHFTVYTSAMLGLIFGALFIYKKFAITSQKNSKSNFLRIEDTLSIGPRKQIFVIKAGGEKFLIASDADRTTLISKLGNSPSANISAVEEIPRTHHFEMNEEKNSAIRKFAKKLDL